MRIQKTVYDVVVAVVADYGRMKKMLEQGNLTQSQVVEFTRKVTAIDNAMLAVCDGESAEVRMALLSDIAQRRGFSRSAAKAYYEEKTFMRRKYEAIRQMARMMSLI